jgi:hypothetical protein
MVIDPRADVVAFFGDAVRGAAETRGYDPEAASAVYVARLLADYAKPEFGRDQVLEKPLVLLLREALDASGSERFRKLRGLGDHALYVSGFFSDHLERRGVGQPYVNGLGKTAYDALATMLRRKGGDLAGPDVFHELAENFDTLVALLSDVADALYASSAKDPRDILDVYERWSRRGSRALGEALVRWGVVPTRGNGTLH